MHSPLPASLTEERCHRYGWALLLALTMLLYLPGLGDLPMMDRDEPRFAHATVEMMQHGTWTVPYFNGGYRFDKPPLTYWWMRLHYQLLGMHELAARMHSVVATWLVAVVILGIGRRLASARAGMLAGTAWLLTLQVLVHGRLCVADMPMVLCVTTALRALLELLMQPSHRFGRWHWVLYLALGFGFLAKGPIAWIAPALALALHRFVFWGRYTEWSTLHTGKGMALALAIVATWGIPALVETRGQFWSVGMGEHVVARGASALNGRFPIPGYYLVTAVLSLFPWIVMLPQIWRCIVQRWTMTSALLVSWFIAPYLIFTFYATQLPHYVMPGFPAAMVLLASERDLRVRGWWRGWSWGVVALFAIATVAVFTSTTMATLPEALRPLLQHGGVVLLILTMLGGLVVKGFHRPGRVIYAGLLFGVLALPLLLSLVLQDLRRLHPAVQLRAVTGPIRKDSKLIGWQFTEPSLVFYFDHEWHFTTKMATVEMELTKARASLIVLLRREWTLSHALRNGGVDTDFSKEVDALVAAHPDRKLIRVEGFNAARSSWVELVGLQSRPER